jgi:hypothetical protein
MLFKPTPNAASGTRQHYHLFVMKKNLYVLACALCTLLSLPAVAQVPAYVPTDGLVGWWPFNGNANDESGNGNDGTVNQATLSFDRFGISNSSYYLNGQTDFISVPDASSMLPSNISLSCWIKIPSIYTANNDFGRIIRSRFFGYTLTYVNSLNSIGFEIWTNSANSTSVSTSNIVMNDDVWHHLIGTFDGTEIEFYFDGLSIGSMPAPNSSIYYSSDGLVMFGRDGNNPSPLTGLYQGWIDDIAIYNRALTEQEIQTLYTGQCPTVATNCTSLPSNLQQGLVGYWPFCGNANDESGNGNDGTVNGATLTEDRFGYSNNAYDLNGNSDFIEFGTIDSLASTELTISLWYSCSAFNTQWNENCLISNYVNDGFMFVLDNGTQPQIRITTTEGNKQISSNAPNLNQWYHAVSVISSDYLKLYINNVLVDSVSMDSSIFTTNDTLVMGKASWFDNTAFYSGKIDEIAIYNRALTPEEVQELYTLDACTFAIYDTVYTYETIYDTVTTYITVTDTLLIDITFTGFEGQPSWLNTVTVFPNPASDHITIDYGNFALMAGYNTVITNAAGATVYSSSVNTQQVDIDINAWGATGVYYMMIYDLNGALVAVRQIVLE